MMPDFRKVLIFLCITVLAFASCSRTKEKQQPELYRYISAYTEGIIKANSSVTIYLATPPDKEFKTGTTLPDHILKLSPAVKGELLLKEGNIVQFIPNEPFKNGQTYNVIFDLGAICEVPEDYKKIEFSFNIIPLQLAFEPGNLAVAEDDRQLNYQGSIISSDVIAPEIVEKKLTAVYEGKDLSPTWYHEGNVHNFTVTGLEKGETERTLKLKFAKDVEQGGDMDIAIPGINDFTVLDVKLSVIQPLTISVIMSEKIDPEQNLNGLVTIQGTNSTNYKTEGNIIYLYPDNYQDRDKLVVSVHKGIRSTSGNICKIDFNQTILMPITKPQVNFIGKGVIMPDKGEVVIPFSAVALKAVDVRLIKIDNQNMNFFLQTNSYDNSYELKRTGRPVFQEKIDLQKAKQGINLNRWNDFTINLNNLVNFEKGVIYRIEIKFKKSYSTLECAGEGEDSRYSGEDWDSGSYYYDYDDYNYDWNERDNPCSLSYYTSNRFISRNIINTSLGLMAKKSVDNKYIIVVNNLETTEPVKNCEVTLYNFQNQEIAKGQTNADGFAEIKAPHKAFTIKARKDNDQAWLKVDDGSSLSLSSFDVSGQNIENGIKGFIYEERGVWRPGDDIYLSFILDDNLKTLPAGHPIIAKLIDPKGNVIQTRKNNINSGTIYCFTFKTDKDAPTGYWKAIVEIGGTSFNKTLRIETVKPNRLSINAQFPSDNIVGKGSEQNTIKVNTRWLHGAKTPDLKAVTEVRLSNGKTTFKNYPDYIFRDEAQYYEPQTETLFDGKTDQNGNFSFNTDKIKVEDAPGMLNASFTTRVFENSGDFSISTQTVKYSPYTEYVGIRLPESDDGWYSTQKAVSLKGVLVDAKGQKVSGQNVELEVYKLNWRWWWDAENENIGSYVNSTYNESIIRENIPVKDGSFTFNLNINDYGRYFIRVKNKSGHAASLIGWFGSWVDGNTNNAATILNISSNKKNVKAGEKIRLTIPSSEGGVAIVSLENGKTVKDIFRVPTRQGSTKIDINTTGDMCPNIYAHITLIQPGTIRDNDRPIRLYGVVNINIEDPSLHLNPVIKAPAEIRPAEEFTVKVSEKDGKPMNYTIAIVDEGLLSLTTFKTPDPFGTFYAREALGVKTWDFYDFIFGAYGARLDQAFAVGGDESLPVRQDEKTNRFKPVVIFQGPFTLKKGETTSHTFRMPEYIGEVRTMVVAAQDGRYGSTSAPIQVKKPLMVNITMPRLFTPGDMIDIPVTVFAMADNIREATVSLNTNNKLEIIGANSGTVRFNGQGEQIITFKTRIKDQTGTGEIRAEVRSGNEKAVVSTDVTIRVPNPRITRFESKPLKAGETITFECNVNGAEPKAVLEVTSIPPLNLEQRLEYLITYPHGCAEQITSTVFPQLSLDKLVQLSPSKKADIEKNVVTVLNRLGQYQTTSGGFAYWPGDTYVADWVTTYVMHFLVTAQKKGYTIPGQMYQKCSGYMQKAANEWRPSTQYDDDMGQAYRLYVLALAGKQDMAAMNRLKERDIKPNTAKWLLAGAYALASHKDIAEKMIRDTPVEVSPYRETGRYYGSDIRDNAIILEILLHLNKQQDALRMLEKIASAFSSGRWISTQSTAFGLLAASDYVAKYVGNKGELNIMVKTSTGKEQLKSPCTIISKEVPGKGRVEITNNSRGNLTARLITSSAPFNVVTEKSEHGLAMSIKYTDNEGKPVDLRHLPQGKDVTAEIRIENTGLTGRYNELALSYLVPSGFEIINERLSGNNSAYKGADYVDIRDDRFYLYFGLNQNETKIFRFKCNASYAGEYILPAIECSAMYDNSINAVLPGGKVIITK